MNPKLKICSHSGHVCLLALSRAQDNSVIELRNADILTMVKAKLPASLIIEKINTSNCSFDTLPSVLAELTYRGVRNEGLTAMVALHMVHSPLLSAAQSRQNRER